MALAKRTVLNRIEVEPNGRVFVKFEKQIIEDDAVLASEPHRAAIEPDTDAAAAMAAVNGDLAERGYAQVAGDDIAKIAAHVQLAREASAGA